MYEELIGKTLNTGDEKYFSKWIIKHVNPSNIEDILKLNIFKERPELLTPSVFVKKARQIEEIVNLEIFKEHPELLTPSVFHKTAEEIEKIVKLEVFKDHPDLLTSSVFFKTAEEIEKIVNLEVFKEHPELLTPSAFNSTAEEIEKIVNLEIFKEHPELLTSSVFHSTAEEIEKIVNLEVFKERPELLTPTIFINNQIETVKSYLTYDYFKLANLITSTHLVIKKEEIYSKAMFLEDNSYALTVETGKGKIKVNPIFIMPNKRMLECYGVSKKDLKRKYDYHKSDVKPIVEERAKLLIK